MRQPTPTTATSLIPKLLILLLASNFTGASEKQLPINPGATLTTSDTLPAIPLARNTNQSNTCRLDLSNELFGGVDNACVRHGLDRNRCCPVLAAWLFAAHARSALEVNPNSSSFIDDDDDGPMLPDDNQKCVDSLLSALKQQGIKLPRPNATCDTVLCFCGIRLHRLTSLSCPAAFTDNNGGLRRSNGTVIMPTSALQGLEGSCRNASYVGCTRCLRSLAKVKGEGSLGGGSEEDDDEDERAAKMFAQDCQLMGLTWLLAKNKTAYIPTVSAVLRAILYSDRLAGNDGEDYQCSADHENMPLAVEAVEFQRDENCAAASIISHFVASFFSFGAFILVA